MKYFLLLTMLSTTALAVTSNDLKDFDHRDIHCINSASKHECGETNRERVGLVYKLSVTCHKVLIVQMPDSSRVSIKVGGTGTKSQSVVQNNMGSAMILTYMNRREMEKQARAQVDDKLKDARSCR